MKSIQERTPVPQLKTGIPGPGLRLYLFAMAERAAPEVTGITPGLLAKLEAGNGTVEPETLPVPQPLGWADILPLPGFAGLFGRYLAGLAGVSVASDFDIPEEERQAPKVQFD